MKINHNGYIFFIIGRELHALLFSLQRETFGEILTLRFFHPMEGDDDFFLFARCNEHFSANLFCFVIWADCMEKIGATNFVIQVIKSQLPY